MSSNWSVSDRNSRKFNYSLTLEKSADMSEGPQCERDAVVIGGRCYYTLSHAAALLGLSYTTLARRATITASATTDERFHFIELSPGDHPTFSRGRRPRWYVAAEEVDQARAELLAKLGAVEPGDLRAESQPSTVDLLAEIRDLEAALRKAHDRNRSHRIIESEYLQILRDYDEPDFVGKQTHVFNTKPRVDLNDRTRTGRPFTHHGEFAPTE